MVSKNLLHRLMGREVERGLSHLSLPEEEHGKGVSRSRFPSERRQPDTERRKKLNDSSGEANDSFLL